MNAALWLRFIPNLSHEVESKQREGTRKKMLGTILVVILVLVLVRALPRWSHSRSWGYAPAGGFGLILLIVLILLVVGRI